MPLMPASKTAIPSPRHVAIRKLQCLGHWLSRQSLRTQVDILVITCTLACTLLLSLYAYQRLSVNIQQDARAWATSASRLAAHLATSTDPNRPEDISFAALTGVLEETASLPGVREVRLVRPGGWLQVQSERRDNATVRSLFPRGQRVSPPASPQINGHNTISVYTLLAVPDMPDSIPTATDYLEHGWIEVHVSTQGALLGAASEWFTSWLLTMVALTAALFILRRCLMKSIGPIMALAKLSTQIAQSPGLTAHVPWSSREVRRLGLALNAASRELGFQIGHTQRQLSRLRAVLDTATDAIISVTPQGLIDNANRASEHIFGPTSGALHGAPLTLILPSLRIQELEQLMRNGTLIHSTQSRTCRIECQALRGNGTAFPVDVLISEVNNDPDIRYTCIVRDLTDRKLDHENLTLYSRAVDCALNGIVISDARKLAHPIVYANRAFSRITGYAPQDVLGQDLSILDGAATNPEDLALLAETMHRGGSLTTTLVHHRREGAPFHNKLSISPVRNDAGVITHYIHVMEDVTGQIEVKQRLIERTARLNAAFHLSPDGFAVFDKDGELTSTNPSMRAMIGIPPEQCNGQEFDAWFRSLCENPETYRPVEQVGTANLRDVMILTHPYPRVVQREVRRNLAGSGETILYFQDITQQTELDRIKSDFLATAAHELRTPLASILGFTELMLHREYPEHKRRELLQTVHRQSELLSHLIQELLDLSRIEARQGKDFHIVPTRLGDIIDNAVADMGHQEAGRTIHVEGALALQVMADTEKIERALLNLLSNAFKYSPPGSQIRLTVDTDASEGAACARIRISDEGLGMTPAQMARAFERFYRADTSGRVPGTGLGLSIVKEIAELHGGSVGLSSKLGQGTTATLRLRLSPTPPQAD